MYGFAGLAVLSALALGACSPTGIAIGAAAKVGTSAAKEKGLGGTWDDTQIRTEINFLWLREDPSLFKDVGLSVEEGRVLLTGQVEDTETRVNAVRLAWQADGVREVINEIDIAEGSVGGFARDAWIIAQLRGKLTLDREVSAINYSIDASNRVVYLTGIARSQAELDRVIGHAKDIAYVRRVVDYVRVRVDPGDGPQPGDSPQEVAPRDTESTSG